MFGYDNQTCWIIHALEVYEIPIFILQCDKTPNPLTYRTPPPLISQPKLALRRTHRRQNKSY